MCWSTDPRRRRHESGHWPETCRRKWYPRTDVRRRLDFRRVPCYLPTPRGQIARSKAQSLYYAGKAAFFKAKCAIRRLLLAPSRAALVCVRDKRAVPAATQMANGTGDGHQ